MFGIYLIIGALAGTMAGMLGIGGGIIVIPALAAVFVHFQVMPQSIVMQMAIGTSLAAMIVTTISAMRSHAKRGSVRWDMVKKLLPGIIIGSIIGAIIAHNLPSGYLRTFFGIFLLVIAYRLLFVKADNTSLAVPSSMIITSAASFIGALGSILGAGGGTLLIPFLLRCHVNLREAAGTSIACGAGICIVATISFVILGSAVTDLSFSTGYIYWPAFLGIALTSMLFAPIGTAIAHKLSAHVLQRVLAIFLVLIAIEMLLG